MCVGVYVCVCVLSIFSNIFCSETTGPIEAKFHMEPPWDGGTKVCSNDPGHMTKMAAMPIYGKNLKKILLLNQMTDDLETWYAASGARVLPNLFKLWRWVDLDIFYNMSNVVPYAFVWEKGKTMDFSELLSSVIWN